MAACGEQAGGEYVGLPPFRSHYTAFPRRQRIHDKSTIHNMTIITLQVISMGV